MLCAVLAAATVLAILLPRQEKVPEAPGYPELAEAIGRYEEEMELAAKAEAAARQERYRHQRPPRQQWQHKERSEYQPRERRQEASAPVELNSADSATLTTVRGIGPAYAARIVKYRARLGGFVRKEQLLEVYGMTEEWYAVIAPQVVVDSSAARRIDPNSATLQELKRHPYLDYYQAKALVEYREKGGRIERAEDLLKVNLMNEETAERMSRYWDIETIE